MELYQVLLLEIYPKNIMISGEQIVVLKDNVMKINIKSMYF
jgi:hypothetical protein